MASTDLQYSLNRVCAHPPFPTESISAFFARVSHVHPDHFGKKYEGGRRRGRFEGEGTYTYADGTTFRGTMRNGAFHGKGTLTFSNGVYEGNWVNGVEDGSGRFVFNDGLPFRKEKWDYCSSSDRRFWSERRNGIKPAGETQRTDDMHRPPLPEGTFDVGNGYYDPTTHMVHDYGTGFEVRQPNEDEITFIESRAPISSSRGNPAV